MPILQAHNLSYQLPAGDTLFHSVSVSMSCNRVGLVGHNGAGKSLLATILTGERMPAWVQTIYVILVSPDTFHRR